MLIFLHGIYGVKYVTPRGYMIRYLVCRKVIVTMVPLFLHFFYHFFNFELFPDHYRHDFISRNTKEYMNSI